MDPRWREPWLAVSAVNLFFFRRWAEVLPGGHDYFLETARSPATYFTLMLLVLVTSACAWGAVVVARRSRRPWAVQIVRVGFVGVAVSGLWGILAEGWVFLGRPAVPLVMLIVGITALTMFLAWWYWRQPDRVRRIVPAAVMLVLVVSPLTPILFAQGLYHGLTPEAASARFVPPLAGVIEGDGEERFVVVLFDGLDERLLFERRPPDLALPAFDRLRNGSLHATHAYAPNAATLRSVPSMTTGEFVRSAQPHSIDGNRLEFRSGGKPVEWRDTPTMFHDARETGHDVGIVGTYHPYCRIFDGVLSKCVFKSHYSPEPPSWPALFFDHVDQLADKLPTSFLNDDLRVWAGNVETVAAARQEREATKAAALSTAAVEMAADPELDLVFLHINTPHPTGIRGDGRGFYDAETGSFATGSDLDYFDNLALADRILGEIRAAMEAEGLWDRSTLLVTADHGHRAELWHPRPSKDPDAPPLQQMTDHRVAFLLKPADATTGATYDAGFNLVVLRGLSRAILDGEVGSVAAAVAWLEAHRTVGPAPYYKVY